MKPLIGQFALAILFFGFLSSFDQIVSGALDFQEEKTGDVVEFAVMLGQIVRFINRHNPNKPALKFSLVGSTVDKIEKANTTDGASTNATVAPGATTPTVAPGPTTPAAVTTPTAAPAGTTLAPVGTTPAPGATTLAPGNNASAAPTNASWTLTMSDKTVAEMHIADADNVTHYEFLWPGALDPIEKRELCLFYRDAHWYNSYQRYAPEWPLNNTVLMPRTPFNYLLDFQNQPQKEEFYFILEHLFITSDGFAIMLDDASPLFIRRDPTGTEPTICISVNNSYPYLENNPDSAYRDIKIKVFAAPNAKLVWDYVMQKSGLIPKPTAAPADVAFKYPSFNVYSQFGDRVSRPQIYDLATYIEKAGFWNSEILINNVWEENLGNFKFHGGLFGSPQEMTSKLHSEKFRVKVQVVPEIVDSNENKRSHRDLYVKDHQGNDLTNFIDFATEEAAGFYSAALQKIHYESGVDAFYITTENLRNFHLSDYWMQQTPSLLTKKYIEVVAKAAPNSTTALAFKTQALPLMVQLSNAANTPFDVLLKTLIPNALAVSLAGYSFIIPYHIGGFWPGGRPNEEIYIRMVQASALMPAMSFSWGPWQQNGWSENAISITKKMVDLHSAHADTIIALAKKRVDEGTPIIRPMWYEAPDDERAFVAHDQFMLGDDIVVAPVIEENARQRSVYLPPGNWVDSHGITRKGPSVLKVAANLEDLPYFKRKV